MQENYNNMEHNSISTPKWKEGYSLSIMIFIGIIGLYYVLQTIHKREDGVVKTFPFQYDEGNIEESGLFGSKEEAPQKPSIQKEVVPRNNQLIIKGEFEANEFIQFIIESYDKLANYELQLGRGNFVPVDKKTIVHSFPYAGTYDIILKASFEGDTLTLHQETIHISKAIKIAQDARREINY